MSKASRHEYAADIPQRLNLREQPKDAYFAFSALFSALFIVGSG